MNPFYQKAWRWHFYAGLCVIPILLTLSVTGIVYLFKPQLDLVVYKHLLLVPEGTHTGRGLSANTLLGLTSRAYPGARVSRYLPPIDDTRSAEFVLTDSAGTQRSVFLDPRSGAILGDRIESSYFQTIDKKIHGELLLGKLGDRIVELGACWALVLILSGLYLWWPRDGSGPWGVWLPRFRSGGRVFWKDLHSVTGVYCSLFIALFVLSGLPWSGFWGDQFSKAWNQFPAGTFSNLPKSTLPSKTLNAGTTQVIPWGAENVPIPKSQAGIATLSLESLVYLAAREGAPPGYTISLPAGEDGVYTISAFTGQPKQELTLHVDQYSGKVLADIRYAQYGSVARLVAYGIALHQGQLLGWPNQLACLIICLSIIGLCVSGIVMWWLRRPAGKLGAPKGLPVPRVWKSACVLVALMGCAFPLVGASLIAVLAIDFLVTRLPVRSRV